MPRENYPDIEPIPDTMENIVRSIMKGPPKKEWRFEKKRDDNEDED